MVEQGLQTSSSDCAARLPFLGLQSSLDFAWSISLYPWSATSPIKSTRWSVSIESHQACKSGWPVSVPLNNSVPWLGNCRLAWCSNVEFIAFSGRTQTWERPTAWEVISHQRNKRDGVCWSNMASVACQGQGGWQEKGFQKKQLLWLHVNMLIKLQSLWPHTQAERLSVFIRHAPWAHRCTTRHRAVCSNILCSRSNGFTSIQEGPSLGGGQVLGDWAMCAGIICTGGQRALKLHWRSSQQHLSLQHFRPFIARHLPDWMGPAPPAEETEPMNVHFALGFLAETRYGIPRGKVT